MDDEQHTGNEENQEAAPPAPLMPLSMPPLTPIAVSSDVPPPRDAVTAEVPRTAGPMDTALMPLSMPPFESNTWSNPAAGGGFPPGGAPPYDNASYGEDSSAAPSAARGTRRALVLVLVVALLFGGLGAGLGAAFSGGSNSSSSSIQPVAISPIPTKVPKGSTPTSRVYAAVEPAVVDINTNVASPGSELEQAAGTGMIVTSSGEVLTNNHVIEDATSITVTIQGRSKRYNARVIGDDPANDVALVKIEGVSGLPHVAVGNSSSLVVGASVYAIGNALGLGGEPSVQAGVVSALNRSISANNEFTNVPESLHGLIQTNAAIQQGDSGGPLVNARGEVIGMDTAAATTNSNSDEPVGFAIPINTARSIANQIAAGKSGNGVNIGLSPFLGIDVAPSNGFNNIGNSGGGFNFSFGGGATPTQSVAGAPIAAVVPHSAAAVAGLQAGDVIVGIGPTKISSANATTAANQVTSALAKYHPGDVVRITIINSSGKTQTANAKLGGIPR